MEHCVKNLWKEAGGTAAEHMLSNFRATIWAAVKPESGIGSFATHHLPRFCTSPSGHATAYGVVRQLPCLTETINGWTTLTVLLVCHCSVDARDGLQATAEAPPRLLARRIVRYLCIHTSIARRLECSVPQKYVIVVRYVFNNVHVSRDLESVHTFHSARSTPATSCTVLSCT